MPGKMPLMRIGNQLDDSSLFLKPQSHAGLNASGI